MYVYPKSDLNKVYIKYYMPHILLTGKYVSDREAVMATDTAYKAMCS